MPSARSARRSPAVSTTDLLHVTARGGRAERALRDPVAVEEPLEIRVAGRPVAVTMRTPGDDVALALGFLFSEGIISSIDDVGTVDTEDCADDEDAANRVDVSPAPGRPWNAARVRSSRRGTLTTSSCGVCGRRSVDDLLARAGPVEDDRRFSLAAVLSSTARLRARQPAFKRTGAIHAAAVLLASGKAIVVAEDVGRHNAVDKAIGALLRRRRVGASPRGPRPAILVVSGRASFEMVQKAAVAKIPVVAAVSAPTSLAISLARACGIALLGFVRDGSANVYAHPERLEGLAGA